MKLYSDTSTNSKDLLNRRPFAKQLAGSIIANLENNQDSIVIGINGSWGNGKSTFLEYFQSELNESAIERGNNNKIICVNYNPWHFSGQENLQRNFLIELLTKLKENKLLNDLYINKKIDWIEDKLTYLSFLKHFDQTKGYVEGLENLAKGINIKNNIRDLKSDVEKLLLQENIFLFIFIDDLDRLTPNETLEIFQLVKLNSNFINTYYVLAYDRNVIEKSLANTFKENAPKYLDKIIQVDYQIPEPLLEQVEYVFFTKIDEFMKKYSIEYNEKQLLDIWHIYKLSYYFKNLRDVYRFLNALYLRLPNIWREVNIYDFVIIEAVRIFDFQNYELFLKWTLEVQKEYKKDDETIKNIENQTTKSLLST